MIAKNNKEAMMTTDKIEGSSSLMGVQCHISNVLMVK